MQLASDAAPKPPSPDRVFEAASFVLSPLCSSSKIPEFLAAGRKGARRHTLRASPEHARGAIAFRSGSTELMHKLWADVLQPVARSGDERLHLRNSWAAACRGLE